MLACVLVSVSCGSARVGEVCNTSGYLCLDVTTMLECRSRYWVALPCRGPGGCNRAGNTLTCDMSLNLADDACATNGDARTIGMCTRDGKGTLVCLDGKLVKADVCKSCAVKGDVVTCEPP
jgi:hypothetical protein